MNHYYVNLVYNELFFYRLFISYYNFILKNNLDLAPNMVKVDFRNRVFDKRKEIKSDYINNVIYDMNLNLINSQKAILSVNKKLIDISMTFPLHI